jgi:hypothetical protein
MATGKKTKLLVGEAEISKFMNGATRYKILKFMKWGAPIKNKDGVLYAHEEALDEFFKQAIEEGWA